MRILKQAQFWWGIAFVGFVLLLRYSGLVDYVSLGMIQDRREQFLHMVSENYGWAVLAYLSVYVLVSALGLPLVLLCTIAGGFLFGVIPGAVYAAISATIGATLFFIFIRHTLGSVLQHYYESRLSWFNTQVGRHGVWFFLSIRFISTIPFFVENTLMGLTKASLWTFVWTTFIGVIPGSLVYAYAGRHLMRIASLNDVVSPSTMMVFVFLALLALVPVVVRYFFEEK